MYGELVKDSIRFHQYLKVRESKFFNCYLWQKKTWRGNILHFAKPSHPERNYQFAYIVRSLNHIFCATCMSSGLATRVTLIRTPRESLGESITLGWAYLWYNFCISPLACCWAAFEIAHLYSVHKVRGGSFINPEQARCTLNCWEKEI